MAPLARRGCGILAADSVKAKRMSLCSVSTTLTSLWDFVVHLRLGFQLMVAPASYLLGGLFSDFSQPTTFIVHFFTVHVLLLGGATAYNSFYDKDEGPVEGLRHPPPIHGWMLIASCVTQVVGLAIAAATDLFLAGIYLVTILGFSFGYSNPRIRWKAKPRLSLAVIGIFGGLSPFAMGFLAGGGGQLTINGLSAAFGSALLVVATFPLAQVHQIDEDSRRGDDTFCVRYGISGVRALFAGLYPTSIALTSLAFCPRLVLVAMSVGLLGALWGIVVWRRITKMTGSLADFEWLVAAKTISGAGLNVFLASLLVVT